MYEGEWKNGGKEGTGKSEWFNNKKKLKAVYIGEYKKNVKHGFGEYRWENEKIFKGRW